MGDFWHFIDLIVENFVWEWNLAGQADENDKWYGRRCQVDFAQITRHPTAHRLRENFPTVATWFFIVIHAILMSKIKFHSFLKIYFEFKARPIDFQLKFWIEKRIDFDSRTSRLLLQRHSSCQFQSKINMSAVTMPVKLVILILTIHWVSAQNPFRSFQYKYSFKPPYLAQKDGSVPFWEYSGSNLLE